MNSSGQLENDMKPESVAGSAPDKEVFSFPTIRETFTELDLDFDRNTDLKKLDKLGIKNLDQNWFIHSTYEFS